MKQTAKTQGIPCGQNSNTLGSVVDGATRLWVEHGNLLYGDIMFGNIVSLAMFQECQTPSLEELYDKYKGVGGGMFNLYFVDTSALSGTIYACGHSKRGEWTVFAKTSGYA
ncbi:hypothetical protein BN1356_02538 [Streptococcus varani]|uniref:Uncharacterized protein n=1 Tax=Streptococcus varani TaxID=1608583 RepID=A0A0E4CTV6_9STRE|nr:hypothetical protein [Streptococcus varani]CQR26179.1 hypothetical protein BN1356_02538 [Streptococcus varani]